AFTGAATGDPAAEGIAPAAAKANTVINAVIDNKPADMDWAGLFAALGPANQSPRAMVLAQPKLDLTALEQGGNGTAFIREQAQVLGLTPDNGYRVRLTGQIPLSDEEFASVAQGTGVSGVVSVALVAILLLLALGSVRIVLAALVTLAIGL